MQLAAFVLLAACKPKPAPATVDASVVDAGLRLVIVDASAPIPVIEAAAPATTKQDEGPPPENLTLTVVASFSTYVHSVHLFHVTDGVAIGQSNGVDWSVLTVSKTKPLQDLTDDDEAGSRRQ